MTTPDQQEPGFEYDGRFYPWSVTDIGKDWMLIDRITGMSWTQFYEAQERDEMRLTVQLAMIATSLRAGNPDWSVQKIAHIVENLRIGSDVEFVSGEAEELPPPNETGGVVPLKSTSSDSSPSSTPQDNSSSETSYATPV